MSVFKCKMCGGALEIQPGATVAECEYCGTRQTLPRLSDDRRANLYDRANHFRRANEFDKAMSLYEQIVSEDGADAEAYWCLVLCRYGIEYVEDPATRRRLPTVNRAQFTSVYDDPDYKQALSHADDAQRAVYEEEAREINRLQKDILAISQKEEPFDVFICYKETDANGRRTQDSVLANDLYHQLTQEGFKVFFSRITLEEKLGTAYEPYIFAALNSAKVMVALGTRPEYFNAVWVKNEWSRYLALIRGGAHKILIPAYKDMDPYDLPEEFSHLQAQDMGKLGFMQDLIRGIKKLTGADVPAPAARVAGGSAQAGSAGVEALLRRVSLFLEDGDWSSADEYSEKVLDIDPECAQAYLGKLMAELQVKKREQLADCKLPFADRNNYQKVLRFADKTLAGELEGYVKHIKERNETERQAGIYRQAIEAAESARKQMNLEKKQEEYTQAANLFETIPDWKDAEELAARCREKAEEVRKDSIYIQANEKVSDTDEAANQAAIQLLETIPGWKDADLLIEKYRRNIKEIRRRRAQERNEREEKYRKQMRLFKKITVSLSIILCATVAVVIALHTMIIPSIRYNKAKALMEAEDYAQAYEIFSSLNGFRNSEEVAASLYKYALSGN